MTIEAKVVLDSVSTAGIRLLTLELTYPRFIHSELMTHRVFSRNAASSRAVPVAKKIERIRLDPAKPVEWGLNGKGMQASGVADAEDAELAERYWLAAKDRACEAAEILAGIRCSCHGLLSCEGPRLNLHKQVANRIVEPYDHITTVVTTTKLANHQRLRDHKDADPTYQALAAAIREVVAASEPRLVADGDWHLPYVTADDEPAIAEYVVRHPGAQLLDVKRAVSVGRVARTSYMRQGTGDIEASVTLHDRLRLAGHWSPFEAVATPLIGVSIIGEPWLGECDFCIRRTDIRIKIGDFYVCVNCGYGHLHSGNFHGWKQYRKTFNEENGDGI